MKKYYNFTNEENEAPTDNLPRFNTTDLQNWVQNQV